MYSLDNNHWETCSFVALFHFVLADTVKLSNLHFLFLIYKVFKYQTLNLTFVSFSLSKYSDKRGTRQRRSAHKCQGVSKNESLCIKRQRTWCTPCFISMKSNHFQLQSGRDKMYILSLSWGRLVHGGWWWYLQHGPLRSTLMRRCVLHWAFSSSHSLE